MASRALLTIGTVSPLPTSSAISSAHRSAVSTAALRPQRTPTGAGMVHQSGRRCQVRPMRSPSRQIQAQGVLKDFFKSWADLTKSLATPSVKARTPYDDLAAKLGAVMFADLAGWHVPLSDMRSGVGELKMDQVLAEAIGRTIDISEESFEELLRDAMEMIPVYLGNNKVEVTLMEVVPEKCIGEAGMKFKDWRPRD